MHRWSHGLGGLAIALLLPASLAAQPAVAQPAAAQPAVAQPAAGRLQGVVFDSVAMRPLGGAVVQAVRVADASQSRTVNADSLGRFELRGLPTGAWAVAAMHPRLDSLGLDQVQTGVEVFETGVSRVTVAVPGAQRLTRLVCGEPAVPGDTSGFLVGTLRSAEATRAPVSGAVRVEWLELTVTGQGFVRTRETRTANAGPDGRFLACNVPVGGVVQVSAAHEADSSGVIDVVVPRDGLQQRDLYVGRSRVLAVPRPAVPLDSAAGVVSTGTDTTGVAESEPASLFVRRGEGRLRGRLTAASGAPLVNARVALRDAGVEARTDANGRFAFAELPTGTWNLDARAVGHEPLTRAVDILADDSTSVAFTMSRLVPVDTVRIRASMPWNPQVNLTAFEERRKAGFGRFMGPADLDKLQPLWFSDILLRFPALRFERAPYGYYVTMRATGMGARCLPRVYVDNVLTPNDGALENFLVASQIAAVEVYSGAFGPPQYMDFLSGCGSILVWTGPRTVRNAR